MKVNKHLKIDAITNSTGRLPRDMENLEIYHYSSSKKEPINVGEMDLTYLIRAFAKCQKTLQEQSEKPRDYTFEELRKEKDEALDEGVSLANQVESLKEDIEVYKTKLANNDTQEYHNLHGKIAKLEEMLEEKDEIIDKFAKEEHRWRKAYYDEHMCKGHVMMFKDIPNDESGWAFVDQMKKHLNKESYKIRVKGQYLIDGEDWRKHSYGQPISKSKCLRVYVYKL
jgi:predicted nuclease with TOPRIM domain